MNDVLRAMLGTNHNAVPSTSNENESETSHNVMTIEEPPENIQADIPKAQHAADLPEAELQDDPRTLEDFRIRNHYPAVRGGELTLVTAEGEPATDPAILTAWEAAKAEIQAQLEARYQVLTAWAEGLLAEHRRVYVTTPDDPTQERETSEKIDDPHHLAAEVLRCEACGFYYQLRIKGSMAATLEGEAA